MAAEYLRNLSDDALSAEMRRLLQPSEIVPPMPDPAGTRRRIMAAAEHPRELTPEEQADIDFILAPRRWPAYGTSAPQVRIKDRRGRLATAALMGVILVVLGGLLTLRYPAALVRTMGGFISVLQREDRPYKIVDVNCDHLILQFLGAEANTVFLTVTIGQVPQPAYAMHVHNASDIEILNKAEGRWPTAPGYNQFTIHGELAPGELHNFQDSFVCDMPSATPTP